MMLIKSNEEIKQISFINKIIEDLLDNQIPRILKINLNTNEICNLIKNTYHKHDILTIENFIIDGYSIDTPTHISVDNEVVHGHGKNKILKEGLIRIDLVGFKNGLYGDAARTYKIGNNINKEEEKIILATKTALENILNFVRVGDYFSKISKIIWNVAKEFKLSLIPELTGHGIGSSLHEFPHVYNFYNKELFEKNDFILKENMLFAIEPLFISEYGKISVDENQVVKIDNSNALISHYETVVLFLKDKTVRISEL